MEMQHHSIIYIRDLPLPALPGHALNSPVAQFVATSFHLGVIDPVALNLETIQ